MKILSLHSAFFIVLIMAIQISSQRALPAETLSFFGGINSMTFQLRPNNKPIPSYSEGDCDSGPLSCAVPLVLGDMPMPAPLGAVPGAVTNLPSSIKEIGSKSFQFQTQSGITFKAQVRIRRNDDVYGINLSCTNPDGNASVSSFVSKESPQFLLVSCPVFHLDATHEINTKLELSVQAGQDFGYLR